MSGLIGLSAYQSLKIYGWWRPLRIINWKIVADRDDLTFKKLFHEMGLDEHQLRCLQTNKELWIKEKGLELADIFLVPTWRIHVTKDMNAKIAEIAMMNLSAEWLKYTHVTFMDLVGAGLTLNLMMLLKLDLNTWVEIGLYRDFLRELTDVQSISLFKLPKNMVLQCVHDAKVL